MRTVLVFLLAFTPSAADVLSNVAAHSDRFGAVSRQIWENPELGFHETKSANLLQQELRTNGFAVESGVAGMPTAFTASWGSGKPVIVLLGEFDALPGLSQKDMPTQDPVQPGAPGHGCGHNLLGSASALAAVAIKEEMQARGLKGTIRYYGTPAEEGGGGKIYMIHAGMFRDVDVVLTWHPGDANRVNLGSNLAINGGMVPVLWRGVARSGRARTRTLGAGWRDDHAERHRISARARAAGDAHPLYDHQWGRGGEHRTGVCRGIADGAKSERGGAGKRVGAHHEVRAGGRAGVGDALGVCAEHQLRQRSAQ